MTSLTSLTNTTATQRLAPFAASPSRTAPGSTATAAAPSTIVTLSTQGLAAAREDAAPISTAVLFQDRATPLFDMLKSGAAVAIGQGPLPDDVDNRFTLGVVTAAGKKVELTLASRGGELLVQMGADADLDDAERTALAGLAQGYQDAIDGLAAQPPRVRLAGLAGVDTGVLRSVDFNAQVALPTAPPATQSVSFHLDAEARTVTLDGPAGKANVTVKTDDLAAVGTRQRQDKAIAGYLRQFDQAASRGRADAGLMTMFKDAFADLSRTATRDDPAATTPVAGKSWSLAREDQAVLTGLADFSASVSATPRWDNPVRRNEVDAFGYEVSQSTKLDGASRDARSIAQKQASRLTAQFHEALQPGADLALNYGSETQNYTYHQIEDSADSEVALQYSDGRLHNATLRQSASQSEHISKYVMGKLESERTIPAQQRLMRDLVATLQPYRAEDGRADSAESSEVREERRQRALEALGGEMGLLGNATDLAGREARLGLAAWAPAATSE